MTGYPNDCGSMSLGMALLKAAIRIVLGIIIIGIITVLVFRGLDIKRENNALKDRVKYLEAQSQCQRVVKFNSLFDIRVRFPEFIPYPVPVPMPIIIKDVDGIPPLDPYPVNPAPKPDPNCRTY